MNYIINKPKAFFLLRSSFENIFLNEYMPVAPGDYVKVFLYAHMYAEHGFPMNNSLMAQQLAMSEEKVDEAWDYWEKMGVVKKRRIIGNQGYTVEFLCLTEQLYPMGDAPIEEEKRENPLSDEQLKRLFTQIENSLGRTLESREIQEILGWYRDGKLPPEVILLGVKYSVDLGKPSFKYISKVLENWGSKGLDTIDKVTEYLDENDKKYYRYKRVLQALGFSRNPSEEEKRMMDKWFDDFGYQMDKVLEACSKTAGIPNPNFNYVDKVLINWHKSSVKEGTDVNEIKPVSAKVLKQYYTYLREKAQRDAETRKKEIYTKIPEIERIDRTITELGLRISKALITNDTSQDTEMLKRKMEDLNEDRAIILTENNYDMNYTDVKYHCEQCSDTGINDNGPCSCKEQRMEEAKIWQKEQELGL